MKEGGQQWPPFFVPHFFCAARSRTEPGATSASAKPETGAGRHVSIDVQRVEVARQAIDLRLVRRGDLTFIFNYGAQASTLNLPANTQFVVGSNQINPFDVVIYR